MEFLSSINPEIVGLTATTFVLLSFLMDGELRIRCINIFGSFLFVVYGYMIGALSVWILDACLIFIHMHKIRKLRQRKQNNGNRKEEEYAN